MILAIVSFRIKIKGSPNSRSSKIKRKFLTSQKIFFLFCLNLDLTRQKLNLAVFFRGISRSRIFFFLLLGITLPSGSSRLGLGHQLEVESWIFHNFSAVERPRRLLNISALIRRVLAPRFWDAMTCPNSSSARFFAIFGSGFRWVSSRKSPRGKLAVEHHK